MVTKNHSDHNSADVEFLDNFFLLIIQEFFFEKIDKIFMVASGDDFEALFASYKLPLTT